jgi:hypothetical protein
MVHQECKQLLSINSGNVLQKMSQSILVAICNTESEFKIICTISNVIKGQEEGPASLFCQIQKSISKHN